MTVHKQSVSLTGPAFDYAGALARRGKYPDASAAVWSELARAREQDAALLAAEVVRQRKAPTTRGRWR